MVEWSGHSQLSVRSLIAFLQCCVTLTLVGYEINLSHSPITAAMQLLSSLTLLRQYHGKCDSMFVLRGAGSIMRMVVLLHTAGCGRVFPATAGCDADPWTGDMRLAFRVIHVVAAVRMLGNGISLFCQYAFPADGVCASRGHRQLHVRSRIRALGVPLHLSRGVLKLVLLRGTRYERLDVEVASNFVRALLLIPISAWSLDAQWRSSGTDRRATAAEILQHGNGKVDVPPAVELSARALLVSPASVDRAGTQEAPLAVDA